MENKPRGSKLDSLKRAEYQADVSRAEHWDVSLWPTWTITGRVMPERCDVGTPPVVSNAVGAGGRIRLTVQVIRSHISAVCAVENGNASVFQIADAVRTALAFPVDYIAFVNRGAYEIVLDLCINNQTGEAVPIPIYEPAFETKEVGICFDANADTSKISIPYSEAGAVPELPTALHDVTAAVRYPRRTFEYCRMAVEVVRRHFDPQTVRHERERRIRGEELMCAALRIERKSLQGLDAVAARSRHGDLIISINWEMRKRALELSWELVSRFVEHLKENTSDNWKLLDIRFEE
jgi:hypothetical protein